ncbi:MAG: hypothetical protein H6742_08975 [Alphaproteobacteria bacterium]|nr:hypothetical protein [Alphaproteobacteria bacterium]
MRAWMSMLASAPLSVGWSIGTGMACAGAPAIPSSDEAPPPAPEKPVPAVIETIDETTVGDLDGTRVPMGNMTTGTYTLPDGTEQRGTICSLAVTEGPGVFVGLGSEVDVDGATWRVVAIEKPAGGLGSVTLQRIDD